MRYRSFHAKYLEMGNDRLGRFRNNASLAWFAEYIGRSGAIVYRGSRAEAMCQRHGWWLH